MMKPTIHLNGTSRADLHDAYMAAHKAVLDALETMARTSPNGRDYYPQGADAIYQADREYRARMLAMQRVLAELEELARATM